MEDVVLWCRVTFVGPDGAVLTSCDLAGPGTPDLRAVDEVARLALLARRIGGVIVFTELAPSLGVLLELAGLGVQVKGQAEFGKEALGIQEVQEEGHTGDLTA
jgi:hypothetical protein